MTLARFTNPMPSVFDRFLDGELMNWSNNANTSLPAVNIKETKDGFEVKVAAPGYDKADFNVELNHDVLTISSEKTCDCHTKEDEQYTRREYCYSSFKRSFVLPDSVDAERISAGYKDGILDIIIPKREEAKPRPKRMIDIQ